MSTTATPRTVTYRASKNADGTFDIDDVPVFAEYPKGKRPGVPAIDEEWLTRAVEKAQFRLSADGYTGTVHTGHHSAGKPEYAGRLELQRVGEYEYEGRPIKAIFANLRRVPQRVFDRIKAGEFPNRSVEVASFTDPEIASLALLDTKAPAFRFRPLDVEETPMGQFEADAPDDETGLDKVFSFTADAVEEYALGPFRTEGTSGSSPAGPTPEIAKRAIAAAMQAMQDALAQLLSCIPENTQPLANDGFPPQPSELGARGGSFDADETEAADEHAGEIATTTEAEFSADTQEDAVSDTAPEVRETTTENTEQAQDSTEFASLMGRTAALEAKVAEQEKKDAIESRYQAAVSGLREFNLQDETKTKLREFARKGQPDLDAFVEAFKTYAPKDPGDPLEFVSDSDGGLPDDIRAEFSATPELAEAAMSASREYDALKASYPSYRLDRAAFVRQSVNTRTAARS